ncbi:MAG: hypothetical protein ACI92Z_000041 [Paracoccaceae bacterium]|jgi:hypothetical protein
MKRVALIFSLSLLAAGPVLACSPPSNSPDENLSARAAADCSFDGGGQQDWTTGGLARDLGNGRIVQIITDFQRPELALVTQCTTARQITVFNPTGDNTTCGLISDIAIHIAPNGRLDLSVGDTLADMEIQVSAKGFDTFESISTHFTVASGMPTRDIPDFYCGCKLYYPDSSGAKK